MKRTNGQEHATLHGKWKDFDDDLEIILEDSLKGPAEKKVEIISTQNSFGNIRCIWKSRAKEEGRKPE